MKTLPTLTAALALLAGAGAANAADVYSRAGSTKDPIIQAAAGPNWTGVYGGIGIGGHFVGHVLSFEGLSFDGIAANGVMGTGVIGADVQKDRVVFGLFADYDFSDAATELSFGGRTLAYKLTGIWTVAGRAGVLVTPHTLVYGLAGYSSADFATDGLDTNVSKTLDGFTAGGGIETQLGGNFYLRAEYRWTGLDTLSFAAGEDAGLNIDTDIHSARAVLTYKIPVGLSDR